MGKRDYMFKDVPSRFWANVSKTDSCWNWTGNLSIGGYGYMSVFGRRRVATHISWFLHHGAFPKPGFDMLHKCDNPKCVNPDHLYEGTDSQNLRDSWERNRQRRLAAVRKGSLKNKHTTHCKRGHLLSESGRAYKTGARAGQIYCLTCTKLSPSYAKNKWTPEVAARIREATVKKQAVEALEGQNATR